MRTWIILIVIYLNDFFPLNGEHSIYRRPLWVLFLALKILIYNLNKTSITANENTQN